MRQFGAASCTVTFETDRPVVANMGDRAFEMVNTHSSNLKFICVVNLGFRLPLEKRSQTLLIC